MKNWLVEIRQIPQVPGRHGLGSPLAWPVVEHKTCFTRVGAHLWAADHAGPQHDTRIVNLKAVS